MLRPCLFAMATLASTVAMGQEMAPPETVKTLWIKPGILLIQQEKAAPLLETRKLNGKGLASASLSLPKTDDGLAWITCFRDGYYWAAWDSPLHATPDHPQIHNSTSVFRSPNGFDWEHIGTLNQSWSRTVTVLPLGENKFFAHFGGLHPVEGVHAPRGFSPFAILRLNSDKKRFEVSHFVEPGFDQPFYIPATLQARQPPSIRGYCSYQKLSFSNSYATPRILGDHIIFPWLDAGYVSVFSASSGALQGISPLYGGVDEAALRSGQFGWAMLGIQPTEDGRLLIAARQEGAVISAVQTRFTEGLSDHQMKDAFQRFERQLREDLQRYPDVAWWTFDPETKHFQRESPPAKFPNRISNEQEMYKFKFRIKADGNLQLVSDPPPAK